MQKLKYNLVSLLAVSAAGFSASAQGFYGQIGYANYDLGVFDANVAEIRGGYQFTPNFGVEAQAGFGSGEHNPAVFPPANQEYKNSYGFFGTATYPLENGWELFGRLGWIQTSVETNFSVGPPFSTDIEDDGVSAGAGARYFWNERSGLSLDYTYIDYTNESGGNIALGYIHRF